MRGMTPDQRSLLTQMEGGAVLCCHLHGGVASFRFEEAIVPWSAAMSAWDKGWINATRRAGGRRMTGRFTITARGKRALRFTKKERKEDMGF